MFCGTQHLIRWSSNLTPMDTQQAIMDSINFVEHYIKNNNVKIEQKKCDKFLKGVSATKNSWLLHQPDYFVKYNTLLHSFFLHNKAKSKKVQDVLASYSLAKLREDLINRLQIDAKIVLRLTSSDLVKSKNNLISLYLYYEAFSILHVKEFQARLALLLKDGATKSDVFFAIIRSLNAITISLAVHFGERFKTNQ